MGGEGSSLRKALGWGTITALLYAALFYFADDFIRLARTTADACAAQDGARVLYYGKATSQACAERGGRFVEGRWWHVLAPIAMAFALSYTHGAFTGYFWDIVGLKARK